jgi:hypothetical protein
VAPNCFENSLRGEDPKASAPAGSHFPNADTAGAVGIWQVPRQAGATLGRFPAANRLRDTYGDKIKIMTVGEPVMPNGARILAGLDGFQF